MARYLLLFCVGCHLLTAGCNRSPLGETEQAMPRSEESGAANATTDAAATDPVVSRDAGQLPTADSSPDLVVEKFLVALRDGDRSTAAALLTSKARDETAKHDLVVAPPGSPNAEFYVGEIVFVDEAQTGAHVKSIWAETEGPQEVSYELVWALRQQDDGWRIAGMATEIVSGERPVFLNFEQPEDMLEKMQQAERVAAQPHEAGHADAGTLQR